MTQKSVEGTVEAMSEPSHEPSNAEAPFYLIKAWQCIGCGKIEAPQNCIGVCQDRRVDLVYVDELKDALAEQAQLRQRLQAFEQLARQLALTTPREGAWERSYQAFQARARELLASSA